MWWQSSVFWPAFSSAIHNLSRFRCSRLRLVATRDHTTIVVHTHTRHTNTRIMLINKEIYEERAAKRLRSSRKLVISLVAFVPIWIFALSHISARLSDSLVWHSRSVRRPASTHFSQLCVHFIWHLPARSFKTLRVSRAQNFKCIEIWLWLPIRRERVSESVVCSLFCNGKYTQTEMTRTLTRTNEKWSSPRNGYLNWNNSRNQIIV